MKCTKESVEIPLATAPVILLTELNVPATVLPKSEPVPSSIP